MSPRFTQTNITNQRRSDIKLSGQCRSAKVGTRSYKNYLLFGQLNFCISNPFDVSSIAGVSIFGVRECSSFVQMERVDAFGVITCMTDKCFWINSKVVVDKIAISMRFPYFIFHINAAISFFTKMSGPLPTTRGLVYFTKKSFDGFSHIYIASQLSRFVNKKENYHGYLLH